tara:strand:- start:18 stop:548 length:531 start_codon:yes stop_codon:yes gene_type:complete
MFKRFIVSISLILALVIVIYNQDKVVINESIGEFTNINNGNVLKNYKLTLQNGITTDLDSIHKKEYLIINLWASWCIPCVDEIPELIKLNKKTNFTVLGINVNDNKKDALNLIAKLDIDYPIVINSEQVDELVSSFIWSGIPTTIIVNKEKIIISTIYGKIVDDQVANLIDATSNK